MSAAGASNSRAEPASALPPLQRQLAAVGIAVADMPQGRRPPLSGFVVAVAALLQAHSRDGLASGILQERLEVRKLSAKKQAYDPRLCTQVLHDNSNGPCDSQNWRRKKRFVV